MTKKLNENETKALQIICNDCDDLDGWGFTRPVDVALALGKAFKDYQTVGAYITLLIEKGYIDFYKDEDEVWVSPSVYSEFVGGC